MTDNQLFDKLIDTFGKEKCALFCEMNIFACQSAIDYSVENKLSAPEYLQKIETDKQYWSDIKAEIEKEICEP